MPHKHNGKVIYYPLRWASDHIQLDLDAVYDHSEADVWMLGLMKRDDNYDENSEFATRIRRDYDGYGIPRFRIQ